MGESSYPVTVSALSLTCDDGPPRHCGPEELTPGRYEATLYQSPQVVPVDPEPVEVEVTDQCGPRAASHGTTLRA